jgi:hypothetical protein
MWQDKLNGLFELAGGVFILLSCIKLYRDKKVRGVSFVHVGYFTLWGYWNIHYYMNLSQWMSLVGSLSVTLINTVWLGMILYYLRKEKHVKNIS